MVCMPRMPYLLSPHSVLPTLPPPHLLPFPPLLRATCWAPPLRSPPALPQPNHTPHALGLLPPPPQVAKGYTLGRISDVRGLRIIVDTKADCYRALRAVETAWHGVGPTKDYIRNPKDNGYRSLHTVVRGEDGHDIEVGAALAAGRR